jgi:uncharacterized protein (DUF302 family)
MPEGYRDWKLISVAHEEGSLKSFAAILGNDVAVKAYRDKKLPYPDGTIIAALHWKHAASGENNKIFGRAQSFVAGEATNVQFMVKDSKKYASTGGWGFGHFNDGKPADATVLKSCFPCHQKIKERDMVFTRYAPTTASFRPQQERKNDMAEPIPGLVKMPSPHGAAKTVERLEAILKEKEIHLFARIAHNKGAAKFKLELRPNILLIFGKPEVGTPLMQSQPTIGIDLPLRVLVWEDEKGKTWLAYNDPTYLAKRHAITDGEETLKGMTSALAALAHAATAP